MNTARPPTSPSELRMAIAGGLQPALRPEDAHNAIAAVVNVYAAIVSDLNRKAQIAQLENDKLREQIHILQQQIPKDQDVMLKPEQTNAGE